MFASEVIKLIVKNDTIEEEAFALARAFQLAWDLLPYDRRQKMIDHYKNLREQNIVTQTHPTGEGNTND
jgi:hypothetical protein